MNIEVTDRLYNKVYKTCTMIIEIEAIEYMFDYTDIDGDVEVECAEELPFPIEDIKEKLIEIYEEY